MITALMNDCNAGSAAMSLAELIEKLKALPSDKQAEVFDFVEFLASRSDEARRRGADWVGANYFEFSLGQALRGIEDDPVVYTADDIRERRR
jgi:hypothetical protein